MDRWLHNNNVLRILALVLACAIWLGVNAPTQFNAGGLSQPYSYLIRVETPPGMVATSVVPSFADVIVTGNSSNLAAIQAEMAHVTVVADASQLTQGSHSVKLSVKGMPSVSYTIDPPSVTLDLKAIKTVQIPLQVHVGGKVPKGYVQSPPQFAGQTVVVSGSTRAVSQVVSTRATVSVQGRRGTFTQVVTIVPLDQDGKRVAGVTVSPSTVSITVPIQSPQTTATLTPTVEGSPAPGYAVAGITINPSQVTVYGLLPTSSSGTPSLTIPVNVTGLKANHTETDAVPTPFGVTRAKPASVHAQVRIEPSETKSIAKVPIQIVGTPSGESIHLTSVKTVTLSLSGPTDVMNALTASDIDAYINGASLTAHDHDASVNLALPDWVHVAEVSASSVAVQVTTS